jgi:hypothetical protein
MMAEDCPPEISDWSTPEGGIDLSAAGCGRFGRPSRSNRAQIEELQGQVAALQQSG